MAEEEYLKMLAELDPDALVEMAESDTSEFRWNRSDLYRLAHDKYEESGDSDHQEACRKEILVFDLSTHASPQTRFRPWAVASNEVGEELSYPDLDKDFNDESFEYYRERALSTNNTILKARYCDVIWELAGGVEWARMAVMAYLDCCKFYFQNEWDKELSDALDRSLALACMMGNKDLQEQSIKRHLFFVKALQDAERPRYLFEIIDSILRQSGVIAYEDYHYLETTIESAISSYAERDPDSFHIQREFMGLLLKISKIQKDVGRSQDINVRMAESLVEEGEWKQENYPSGNMVAAKVFEEAMQAYMNLGIFPDRVDELKLKIIEANKKAEESEYRSLSAEIEIPTKKIDDYLSLYRGKNPSEVFAMIFHDPNLIPSFEKAKEDAVEQSKKFVLLHMASVSLMKGEICVKSISDEDEKLEYDAINNFQMVYQACENLFLEPIFEQGELENTGFIQALADYLSESEIISEDRLSLVRHALSRIQEQDYISGIHILVFQVEGILRDLVTGIGAPTFTYRNKEMREINLSGILVILNQVHGIDTDTLRFIDVFLNDIRGDNYRNDIAHGLLKADSFNERNARLLMLILVKIAPYGIVKRQPETEEGNS